MLQKKVQGQQTEKGISCSLKVTEKQVWLHQENLAVGIAHRCVGCLLRRPVLGHVQAETGYHLAVAQALYERSGLVTSKVPFNWECLGL